MSKEHGVAMSEGSVLGLLTGRKTETRRPASNRPLGQVGDYLYVRETWKAAHRRRRDGALQVIYRADGRQVYLPVPPDKAVRLSPHWRPGRFMFKFMARFWLKIEAVTPQALHDMGAEAAIREGIFNPGDGLWYCPACDQGYADPVLAYAAVWDGLYAKTRPLTGTWRANPQVVAYRFRVVREDPYNEV